MAKQWRHVSEALGRSVGPLHWVKTTVQPSSPPHQFEGCNAQAWERAMWQGRHSVRRLCRSHRPPPLYTGLTWSACQALPSTQWLTRRSAATLCPLEPQTGASCSSSFRRRAFQSLDPLSTPLQQAKASQRGCVMGRGAGSCSGLAVHARWPASTIKGPQRGTAAHHWHPASCVCLGLNPAKVLRDTTYRGWHIADSARKRCRCSLRLPLAMPACGLCYASVPWNEQTA